MCEKWKIRPKIFHFLILGYAHNGNQTEIHPNRNLKLMDQVREVLRYHHYAFTTEKTYCKWILKYIRYFGVSRHPQEMGAKEAETFLSHLATSQMGSSNLFT